MKLVFDLDDVICTPPKGINFGIVDYIKNAKPIEDVAEDSSRTVRGMEKGMEK